MPSFGTCFGKRRAVGIPGIGIPRGFPGDRSALVISVMWIVWLLGLLVGLCLLLSMADRPQL